MSDPFEVQGNRTTLDRAVGVKYGKTTYILGAGASFHAGYPFIRTMGAQLLEWMRVPRASPVFDFADTAIFLEERFGDQIESLFNGVQREIDSRAPGYSIYANVHRPCLIEAMRQWFSDIQAQHPAVAYERFASDIVNRGDTIITLNYDVALDSKLRQTGKWEIGDGYGFTVEGFPNRSAVKILKLHGSINWLALVFGGSRSGVIPPSGPFGSRPVFGTDALAELGYPRTVDPRFTRPAAAVQPLVLPTSRKRFYFDTNLGRQWEPFWTRIWRSARRALQASDRIIVCGYGMYPVDRRGRNLLLSGKLHAEIEVCCGDRSADLVRELQSKGRVARQAEHSRFEKWVLSQAG